MSFLARKEPFGGVLAKMGSEEIILLDQFAFDVVKAISRGLSADDLYTEVERVFPGSDVEFAKSQAAIIYGIIDGSRSANELQIRIAGSSNRFPTLSAPLDLYWEITRRCNESCAHCYNNSSPSGFNPSYRSISKVIDELSDYRFRNITLSGGEPMMRRDFWEIADRLRPLTRELTLGTNATLINPSNIDRVEQYFDVLNVSLDDPDEASFDTFRGYHGAFRRTVDALRLLENTKCRIYVQTVLTRHSLSRLRDLGKIVASLRPSRWVVRFAFESGRARENSSAFLSPKEIFDVSDFLDEVGKEFSSAIPNIDIGSNYPWSYKEPYPYKDNPNKVQTCAAATTNAALDAFGRMAPCSIFTETDFKSPSVYNTSFMEQWRNSTEMEALRTLGLSEVSGCGTCANATTICGGGCRAMAYMRYGTIKKNDYSCNYSKP